MLLRQKPFKEWITVYYEPGKITEDRLLKLLRERRCARARLDRAEAVPVTVMNPQVGPGDLVQLRVSPELKAAAGHLSLPKGWKVVGNPSASKGTDGTTWFSIQTDVKTAPGTHGISLAREGEEAVALTVEVVRKVGS